MRYLLWDTNGDGWLTTGRAKRGKVKLKGGLYQTLPKGVRNLYEDYLGGLFRLRSRIIVFSEPYKRPALPGQDAPPLTPPTDPDVSDADSAWVERAAWEAREMEGMYEKEKPESPLLLIILLLSVAANIMLALKVI